MTVLMLIFCCVAANHLGLIQAIESVIKRPLPIVNCSKCLTFWATMAVLLPSHNFLTTLATAFAAAYAATWAELAMGVIDTIYIKVYEQICRPEDTDTEVASISAGNRSDTSRAVSGVRKGNKPKNN